MVCRPTSIHAPLIVAMLVFISLSGAQAQDEAPRHRHRATHAKVAAAPVAYRGLTINKQPETGPADNTNDIYRDGPVRYNDVRDFSPAPYVTSGVEYPYGLDGIGGYGSDLGVSAGQDAALYNRGAGTP